MQIIHHLIIFHGRHVPAGSLHGCEYQLWEYKAKHHCPELQYLKAWVDWSSSWSYGYCCCEPSHWGMVNAACWHTTYEHSAGNLQTNVTQISTVFHSHMTYEHSAGNLQTNVTQISTVFHSHVVWLHLINIFQVHPSELVSIGVKAIKAAFSTPYFYHVKTT